METIELHHHDLFGWFVERILEARRLREKHDVLFDEDPGATIYLAGLLDHLCSGSWLGELDRKGERLDMDVASRTSKADTPRSRMETYRITADRYLLYLGLWDGLQGHQQGRFYQITEDNLANRARAYYGYAADLAERLPPPSRSQARVLGELSGNLGTYLAILLTLRGDILNLVPRLGAGQEFHLERGSLA